MSKNSLIVSVINRLVLLFVGTRSNSSITIIDGIANRELLKRCLVLCRQSVHESTLQNFLTITPKKKLDMEQEIYSLIPLNFQADRDKLVFDFPKFPDADEEAGEIYIQASRDSKPEILKNLLPDDDWLRSYTVNKYRAHIFYISDDNCRKAAADAAEQVFSKRGIKVTPLARHFANL